MSSLHEHYRPMSLNDVVGQDEAIASVRAVLHRGWGGRAWWITGASGTGKTTLARIIASEGAEEWGTEEIDAASLTPARLRELEREYACRCIGAKTGRCYIVNEAHGLRRDTVRQLLVNLERLPPHVVWIFTTTVRGQQRFFDDGDGDALPLISRCTRVSLSDSPATQAAMARRALEIARAEGIDGLPLSVYEFALAAYCGNMRALLQGIESGEFMADARAARGASAAK